MGNRKAAEMAETGQLSSHAGETPHLQEAPDVFDEVSQSSFSTGSDDTMVLQTPLMSIEIDSPTPSHFDTTSNPLFVAQLLRNNTEVVPSTPNSISITIAAVPEALTKFTVFPKLPLELRFKIYNLVLEPQAVYISRRRKWEPRQAISMVCKEAKQEYERQYKVLKKRASELRPRFGPIFVNYSIDLVHFFHTSFEARLTWASIIATKIRCKFDLVGWLKPAQKVAIRLKQRGGNRGLCAPQARFEHVWEYFNCVCPNMKELVFIICNKKFPMENLVELKDFGGIIGEGETELRASFKAAQLKGFNVSAKLVVMGSPSAWVVSNSKTVEMVDISRG